MIKLKLQSSVMHAAGRAGERVFPDALSGRFHSRRTCREDQSDRGASAGQSDSVR